MDNEEQYNERLLRLEGAIARLQAVNGVILNYFTQVGSADMAYTLRSDPRHILGRVIEYPTFDVLSHLSPFERNYAQEGFRDDVANVLNKIVSLLNSRDTHATGTAMATSTQPHRRELPARSILPPPNAARAPSSIW